MHKDKNTSGTLTRIVEFISKKDTEHEQLACIPTSDRVVVRVRVVTGRSTIPGTGH